MSVFRENVIIRCNSDSVFRPSVEIFQFQNCIADLNEMVGEFCTDLYRSYVQYCTVQYCTVQYSTVQYCTVQYSTVLALQHSWLV